MSIEKGIGLVNKGAAGRKGWNKEIAGWNVGRGEREAYEGDGEGKEELTDGDGGETGFVISNGELGAGE